jgi:predicted lipid-binding transport protein (Tim44 family)
MNIVRIVLVYSALALLFPLVAQAQDPFVYPNQGQSNEQMEQDKFQCYNWAKQQSGFDPMQVPTATSAPPPKQSEGHGVVGGAARGALGGLAVGAIAGDSRKGAKIGAASGGLVGGMRRNDARRQNDKNRQQWEQQQTANYANQRNNYNRAYSACLGGRGYTVN